MLKDVRNLLEVALRDTAMEELNGQKSALSFRTTTLADIPFVIQTERHPDNAPYIGQWCVARHEEAIASQDEAHFILEADGEADGQAIGYFILTGLSNPHRAIHLKRIVVIAKGKGYGRQILRWVKAYTFETLGFHRLWFDVIISNERAKALYLSEGFTVEGTMRDSWQTDKGYEDMLLLSMLKPEYEQQIR